MDNMERLLAYGLDYYDAELCIEVAQLDDATLRILSHGIAVSKLIDDEDLQYTDSQLFVSAHPLEIMLEGLESNPISLN
jgi:hypothetical protein